MIELNKLLKQMPQIPPVILNHRLDLLINKNKTFIKPNQFLPDSKIDIIPDFVQINITDITAISFQLLKINLITIKKLIKGGIIIVFGTLVGSMANYFYNTLTGRLLGPSNYGSFTSLLSLLALVSVPTLAIQTVAAKFSSRYIAENNLNKTKTLVLVLHQKLWIIGLGVTLILVIFSRPISNYLNISSL